MQKDGNVFDRTGLAALSDLKTPEWRELFDELEREQNTFEAYEGKFRSREYKWPRDPLHTWSRIWEYPYIFYHLRSLRSRWSVRQRPKVVDLGSGVTFFPFAVARLGFDVTCLDIDPICEKDLNAAISLIHHAPGNVSFRLIEDSRLPAEDSEVNVIYCISVLEHIRDVETTISETARILKQGGLLILSFDIDLRGDQQLGVAEYGRLQEALARYYEPLLPDETKHPADVLTSITSPLGFRSPHKPRLLYHDCKQVVKVLLGRPEKYLLPFHLAVQGLVLRRRRR